MCAYQQLHWLQHTVKSGGPPSTLLPLCVKVGAAPAGAEEEASALGLVTSSLPPLVQPGECMDLWELIIISFTAVALSLIQVFGTRGREVQAAPPPGNRRDRGHKKG